MAYGRNQFIDPRGVVPTYAWQVNHDTEDQFGRERQVTTSAPTGNVGLVRQQGEDSPLVISLSGSILHAAQHAAMRRYFDLSRGQTVIFTDFAGDSYEVLVTSFKPTRQRTIRNPRDSSIELHYWHYTLDMQVIRVISGPWAGTAP